MARPKTDAPQLRYHISGQSVVTVEGRDFYLGRHNAPLTFARYAVLIGVYQQNGLSLPCGFKLGDIESRAALLLSGQTEQNVQLEGEPVLVRHVTANYRKHVEERFATNKTERLRLLQLCSQLEEHDGDTQAEKYGPLALQRQRKRWIDSGCSRKYCNRLARAVVRMFRFAVSQEVIDTAVWERLQSIEPLRFGETVAKETKPVKPVSIKNVRATAANLSPVLKAMIRVQLSTGMRPSELCSIRPRDIDRTEETWMFRPANHKTAHHGKVKAVPIVGDARDALTDYLNRDPEAFCFSPAESLNWYQAAKRATRKTKVQPSQVSRAKPNPKKRPGERFTPNAYRQSIQRAAKAAQVPSWHPYQLRHLAGTAVRDALGIEAAQALLGHSHVNMTEHYAKLSEAKAIEAAKAAPRL